jgi:hypothetical protein
MLTITLAAVGGCSVVGTLLWFAVASGARPTPKLPDFREVRAARVERRADRAAA